MPLREGDPESIGEYRIESRIGTGGMGVVYLATSPSGRAVAVKLVHAQYADHPEFRARFRQEVAAARRVSGAFTAPVVDADPDADRPWMATAYVAGNTLAQQVADQGPLVWAPLRGLAVELAEALREIHRAEVVHRDLKPSNVLLLSTDGRTDGAVRVIDFGISRAAHSDIRTQTGLVMGSPPFMAPEQFSSPRDVGPPVDVFSLGALLVYAATGRSPFEAENAYLAAYQTVHNDPELGTLHEAFRPLVLSCLTKEPQDRPTPAQVLDALAELPQDLPGEPSAGSGSAQAGAASGSGGGTTMALTGGAATARKPPAPVRDTPVRVGDGSSGDDTAKGTGTPRNEPSGPPARNRRARIAVGAVAVMALASIGGSLTLLTDDTPKPETTGRYGADRPSGWQPWAVDFPQKSEEMPPTAPLCTPAELGVYCSSWTEAAYRLDPGTGRKDWNKPLRQDASSGSGSLSAPVVSDGVVFVASADGSEGVDAYDARTGHRLWRLKGPVSQFEVLSGVVVVHKGRLSESDMYTFAALDARTGDELWRQRVTTDSAFPYYAGPDGTLFVDVRSSRTGVHRIERWNARTGRIVGTVTPPKGDLWLATVHDGTAYYARWEDDSGVSSRFHIQDLTSGATRTIDFPWAVEPEAPPLVRGDAMYLFDYGSEMLLALDLKNGEPLWTTSRQLRIFSEPSLRNGELYTLLPDDSVLAVNARTGKEVWRSAPALDDGKQGPVDERGPSGVAPLVTQGVVYGVTDQGVFSAAAGRPAAPGSMS